MMIFETACDEATIRRTTVSPPACRPAARAKETFGFFRAWIADPLRVAAVAPSGKALARLMTSEISEATGPVIELGPGTGAFTYALIERGVPQQRLALIELGSEFAVALGLKFPDARIFWMDATRLPRTDLFDGALAGATVSGLPVLSMPPRKVMAILGGAFRRMRPDGAFYQFTYGRSCPIPQALLDRMGLKATLVGRTLANVPPASVFRIRRRPPSPAFGPRD